MGRENRLNVADGHTDRQTDIYNYRVASLPTTSLDFILWTLVIKNLYWKGYAANSKQIWKYEIDFKSL